VLSRLEGKGQPVLAVGFSRDGRFISWGQTWRYTAINDRSPLEHRFDLAQLARLPGGLPPAVAVRAQEQVGQLSLAVERGGPYGLDYRLHVYSGTGRSRQILGTIERSERDGYWHSAYTFTPDGQYVLSGALNGALGIYTLAGKLRARLVGHSGEVKAVAVSADGRWALSGAADQTLILWSLAALPSSENTPVQPALTLFPATDGAWVAWTPEGYFTASAQGAQLVGYSMNQGPDKLARYVAVEQLYERFYRPDLLHARLYSAPEAPVLKAEALPPAETVLASGLPPQVTFVSPVQGSTVNRPDIDVQVALTDQGGGIGKIVWRLDGTTVAVHPASAGKPIPPTATERARTTGQSVRLTPPLTLMPGTNTLEVLVYNRQNEIAAPPEVLTLTLAAPPPASLTAAPATPPVATAPPLP
jgi:WD40 repeat protein